MESFFKFEERGTNLRTEILAGVVTFMTMAYIIFVNPGLLSAAFGATPEAAAAWIPALATATTLGAALMCIVMGVFANRPFALASGMGLNAVVAFSIIIGLKVPWQVGMSVIFVEGIVILLLVLTGLREAVMNAIPLNLKRAIGVGIGLFITFIGLNETGIVVAGVPGAPVRLGNMADPSVVLALTGFLLTVVLMVRRVRGAIIIGILTTTVLSFLFGVTPTPKEMFSIPPDPSPIFLRLDIAGACTLKFFPIVLTIFIMSFVDTVGTLIGLSYRAGLLDEKGNLPEIEKPMLADAIATTVAPLVGTSTTGAFIESAAGIEEGGRTGFTALVTASLFLLSLFLAPLFTAVPPHAYGIALMAIGMMMLSPVTRIDFDDYSEFVPAFITIAMMSFTYNIGVGMTAGLLSYPLIMAVSGRYKEVTAGMWILAAISLLFFIFYPKG